MSKFKKGDRVRIKKSAVTNVGKTGVIVRLNYHGYDEPSAFGDEDRWFVRFEGETDEYSYTEKHFELIDEPKYKPITPKVGEKYRVLKKVKTNMSSGDVPVGFVTEVMDTNSHDTCITTPVSGCCFYMNGGDGKGRDYYFTTEYLELVEETPSATYRGEALVVDQSMVADIRKEYSQQYFAEPIIKGAEIKPKTKMNFIKKLTQSKSDKTLEKARFTDECGDLTRTGTEALLSLVFKEKKDELVKLAEEIIKENEG